MNAAVMLLLPAGAVGLQEKLPHIWQSFNVTQYKACVAVIESILVNQSMHSVIETALTSTSINVSCFKAALSDF